MVSILGIPFDANSSFMKGPAQAPAAIREAYQSPSSNLSTESGLALGTHPSLTDQGDIDISQDEAGYLAIEQAIQHLLNQEHKVLALGGDHSVTYPILKAYGAHYDNLTVLHLDAHPDLYDELDDNRHSHACPFARIMESGLVKRLVQVGIRTMNNHQRLQAERFGVEVYEMARWQDYRDAALEGPLYLSVDLDVLDPAFAPGVSHHEPGGLSTRALLTIIQGIQAQLVGADIVELNPVRDVHNMTAMVAAKVMKEVAGKMISQA